MKVKLKHLNLKIIGKILFVLISAIIIIGIALFLDFYFADEFRAFFLSGQNGRNEGPSLESLIVETKPASEKDSEASYATSHKEEQNEPEKMGSGERTAYATSHKEETQEPLTDEAVSLSDIYAEKGVSPVFKIYYPDAEHYTWEIYDTIMHRWKEIPQDEITDEYDELYRKISVFHVPGNNNHDEFMVRCTVDFLEKESITEIATLHILEKDIEELLIEDFSADSGYISAQSVPVTVQYKDGSQETLSGLYGLHFLSKQEFSEHSTTVSGNSVETITTVITACDYFYLELEEMDVIMRYQAKGAETDIPVKITGEDLTPPVITELSISDFKISNIDIPIPVTVTIQAEDNSTPYPKLQYAFLPEGQEAEDDDWHNTPSFEVDITQNGKWFAYCKDLSGNVTAEERNMIVVDNKAPVVSVALESESWCKSNKILVNAKDGLSVEYCYSCAETGENSGWTARNEYEVTQNGTWKIKVRDAVGNITEQDITVDNIDSQMPVIRNITEKSEEKEMEEGEIIIYEKKN